MNRAFEKKLSRALATELDTAVPETLLRWVRPEWMMTGAVPLFAGQLCLLRFVQLSELPKGLPLAAGVLVLCMVLQCIRLAARSEYIAEG